MRLFLKRLLFGLSLLGCSAVAAADLSARWAERELQLSFRGNPAGQAVLLETADLRAWSPAYAFILQNPLEIIAVPPVNQARFYLVVPTNYAVPSDFVWIAPGRFVMGSPESEVGRRVDEGPQRLVKIRRGFWMGAHEVTVREYEQIMHDNPSMSASGSSCPVENITFAQAMEYCRVRTLADVQSGALPPACHYRLPSEAEWEYACRAGTTQRHSFGEDAAEALVNDYGWLGVNAGGITHPVGEKPPNPWGLYDMHGNVFEWCLDFYGIYPGGQRVSQQKFPIYRGGSWYCPAHDLRSAGRHPSKNVQSHIIGFRLVIGTEADTVLPPLDVADLEPQLTWAEDGTSVTVAATTGTAGTTVRYGVGNQEPMPLSSPSTAPVVSAPTAVLAIGFKDGFNQSATLKMDIAQLPAPTVKFKNGAYIITTEVADVMLEYAITYPDWQPYTGPVAISGVGTLKARVRKAGWLTSPVTEWNY